MIKIGLFDSGIGGFSVLKEIFVQYPQWEVFYIADHRFAPYGMQEEQVVIERSLELSRILIDKQVDLIIVACNTATALSINTLRAEFPEIPFVGIEPYLNVINRHHELLLHEKGVVLSTVLTNSSQRFTELRQRLDPDDRLDYVGLENLATIIEQAFTQGDDHLEQHVFSELHPLINKQYDFAILGCTHYPLVGDLIKQTLQVKMVYDPSSFVVKRAASLLSATDQQQESQNHFNFWSTATTNWQQRSLF